ncbi:MAG TPA: dTDP-4-amino-4,6-dideoxygalactose transaminase [Flavipsychrobacter sp.]
MMSNMMTITAALKGLFVMHAINGDIIKSFRDKEIPETDIPFNRPYLTGFEQRYINDVLSKGQLSGDGHYSRKCQEYFKMMYNVNECLLTTSCTDALEMAAILLDIQPGDEVIMPSYTFVSTANAFILRGAKAVFADSRGDFPGIDEDSIEALITPKTKAIVVVHYAGIATDMDRIMDIADRHNLYVVEDAAQAVDAYYKNKALGTIGHLGVMSFHETKNIISGEGGMLMINDKQFSSRAEVIREKGTNRANFLRGEVDKYGWVDVGSSFLPNEMTAAFLYAQLEQLQKIQAKRMAIWHRYYEELKELEVLGFARLPVIPDYAVHNGHIFYLVLPDHKTREALRTNLKKMGISAVFHYNPLHSSDYFGDKHDGRELSECENYDQCLLRLPIYAGMTVNEQKTVINKVWRFFLQK